MLTFALQAGGRELDSRILHCNPVHHVPGCFLLFFLEPIIFGDRLAIHRSLRYNKAGMAQEE